jgi:hypothetical protein
MNKNDEQGIDCKEALKLISEYVDKQTSEKDAQGLEKHLESCRHCFDRVEFAKLLKGRLKGLKLDVSTAHVSAEVKRFLEDL